MNATAFNNLTSAQRVTVTYASIKSLHRADTRRAISHRTFMPKVRDPLAIASNMLFADWSKRLFETTAVRIRAAKNVYNQAHAIQPKSGPPICPVCNRNQSVSSRKECLSCAAIY